MNKKNKDDNTRDENTKEMTRQPVKEEQIEVDVGWVLWHNNFCRLFNAKSIFIQIIGSISNNSV